MMACHGDMPLYAWPQLKVSNACSGPYKFIIYVC